MNKINQLANIPQHKREEVYLEMFMDWTNNFLTVTNFAEHYSTDKETAIKIIDAGRLVNERLSSVNKTCKGCLHCFTYDGTLKCRKADEWCKNVYIECI